METPPINARTRTRANGSVSTTRELRNGKESVELVENTDKIPVDIQSIKNPAYVTIKGGLTKNLGNFESVRVDVGISLPCAPTENAIMETYDKASVMVDDLVNRELRVAMNLPDTDGFTDPNAIQ